MKKVLVSLLLLLLVAGGAQAQFRKVPSDVTNAFKTKFPEAKDVEWKDRLTAFKAGFTLNGINMSASFNSKGEWQETEKALSFEEAPASIKEGLAKSKYASPDEWKTGDVVTLITRNDSTKLYRVYVDKVDGIQKKYLFFNESGQMIKEALTL